MIVEDKHLGVPQGIGTALLEESLYDEMGTPARQLQIMMPSATDAPMYRADHMESPRLTEYGIKAMGEGGTIPTPAAIGNAINDALKQIGAEVMETPFTRAVFVRRSGGSG